MSDQINSPLNNLERHLLIRLSEYQSNPVLIGNLASIEKAVTNIRKNVGNIQGRPTEDRIQEALTLLFTKGPDVALKTHLRYVFWGLIEPWGDKQKRALADAGLFNKIVREIEKLESFDIPFSAWRGLVSAYFGWVPVDREQVEFKNWLELRRLILSRVRYKQEGFKPAWFIVLIEHINLLGDSPCDRYGSALLNGDDAILKPLKDELKIPNISWFWSDLFLSQVKSAAETDDDRFLNHIEKLLPKVSEYKFSADAALTILLERYNQSKQRARPHILLREEAINFWGSPHLERNARWGQVKAETKAMIQNWLVVKALDDFFRLLQEDNAADERRLNFWLRYQQSIGYFHFALGPEANQNRHKDYQSFRTRFRDHICQLTSQGKRENNAFLLQIGRYWIVEFGAIGNACYIYESNNVPFDIASRYMNLYILKDKRKAILNLSHNSDWEYRFDKKLNEIGIYPDKDLSLSKREIRNPHSKIDNPETKRFSHATLTYSSAISEGKKIAEDYALKIDDQRYQIGGGFWILWDKPLGPIAERLSRAGYKFYQGRGWWHK
jgi:hypothetical protein